MKASPHNPTPTAEPEKSPEQRRRSVAEVFGDVLPERTGDERGDRPDPTRDDELLREVPPHHG